ncbi:peroxide stress protein YaaA [Subdoligranulum variabile]|uniref:UPF0246 protein SUBVAR_04866 n=1 Tax=Subdoligranulum variabile DSM 15176 TaxID=411471 RepID=D1PKJ0_9FIRM|nr:peroxide stress protein YaaA [Subdoligranulum variabile]EFB76498.1 hypothetical protein SUBVAR_04866 [Subdoligranulum variabile DSM 15176]UWP68258.1 peroxide stress protein YaaA [Subdoligranulum variabile]
MRIILSPAKKMHVDLDSLPWQNLPDFLDKTQMLRQTMRAMSYEEIRKVWKCNDTLARLNVERLQKMDLRKNLTPAILSYEGIQYQYMAPGVFNEEELAYVQEHLRILSGFYGMLRPFDGVTPYRLEMQAKLPVAGAKDIYAFWGDCLAKALFAQTDCIVNLASKEYSMCISRYRSNDIRFVTCIFGEIRAGKILEKATMCKMARGEMVRFMAERHVKSPEELKEFDRMQFVFSPDHSDNETYVFLKNNG